MTPTGATSGCFKAPIPPSHTYFVVHSLVLFIPQILLLMCYSNAPFSLQEKTGSSLFPPHLSPAPSEYLGHSLLPVGNCCSLWTDGPWAQGQRLVGGAIPCISHGAWWWVLHCFPDGKCPVGCIQSLNGHVVIKNYTSSLFNNQ